MAQKSESRTLDKVIVRFPDGMRDQLKELAREHKRSMNAEIVARLIEFEEMDARLYDEILKNQKLEEEVNRLRALEASLATVKDRFLDENGKPKPLLSVPSDLYARITEAAIRNHRSVDGEAVATLEEKYPTPAFSVEIFERDYISKIMEADGEEKERLVSAAQAYVRSFHPSMSVWLEDNKKHGVTVAFGLRSILDASPEEIAAADAMLKPTDSPST